MTRFMFAYKKELKKLLHRKKYIVLVILGVIASLIRFGGTALFSRMTDGSVRLASKLSLEMLPFAVEVLAPLVILFAVCDLFASELSHDTMKVCLLQPASRFKLLTAKALAALTFGAAAMGVLLIANLIMQLISGSGFYGFGTALLAYIIDIIPLCGIVFLGIIINLLVRSAAGSAVLSLAVYALMKYLGIYTASAGAFLFTAGAKLHLLLLGHTLPLGALMCKLGILFGSILILYSLSYIIFEKKSV